MIPLGSLEMCVSGPRNTGHVAKNIGTRIWTSDL